MLWIIATVAGSFIFYVFLVGIFHGLFRKMGLLGLVYSWSGQVDSMLVLAVFWPFVFIGLGVFFFTRMIYRGGRGIFSLGSHTEDR